MPLGAETESCDISNVALEFLAFSKSTVAHTFRVETNFQVWGPFITRLLKNSTLNIGEECLPFRPRVPWKGCDIDFNILYKGKRCETTESKTRNLT